MRFSLTSALIGLAIVLQAQLPIIDYSFQAATPGAQVYALAVQPDGKILVGGAFNNYAGSGKNYLVRLNADGTLDPGWNPGGAGPNQFVRDIVVMPDGRILAAGQFSQYNGQWSFQIARLMPDGTRDASFQIPVNAINGAVRAIDLQKNDKVVAVGEFFECFGHSTPHIARFNADGSLDMGFDFGTGFNDDAHDVLVLPDLRILVTGKFALYNGQGCGLSAVLTEDGPIDTTAIHGNGLSGTGAMGNALARQADGKLLVAGYFQYLNGAAAYGVVRLNPDGTRDNSFTSAFYPFAHIRAMTVQADGRILVGGEFTENAYNGGIIGPNRLARLNSDGSLDTTFAIGTGPMPDPGNTAYAQALAVQADGKILVGGHFDLFDTETQYKRLIRLYPDAQTGIHAPDAVAPLPVFFDAAGRELLIRDPSGRAGPAEVAVHDMAGRQVLRRTVASGADGTLRVPADLAPGVHLVSLTRNGLRRTAKVPVP